MTYAVESHSLFEIDNELDDLLEQIEEQVEAEGEPSEELLFRFREFCAARGQKVDRIGRFVRMMEAREQFCRTEAARLSERARVTANKVSRTKSMVLFYLMSRELRKIEGREFTLRVQKNSQDSVRILDELSLPTAYRKIEARVSGVLWEAVLSHLPESADLCFSHCGTENWTLSCAFRNSTPPSVAHNIDHQRKSPINPSSTCILCRKMLCLLPDGGSHEDAIPRGTEKTVRYPFRALCCCPLYAVAAGQPRTNRLIEILKN